MRILAFAAAAAPNAVLCAWLGMILFRARGGHETLGVKSKGTWMPVWALLAALPHGTQQVGFFSYGAIAPRPGGGELDVHHSTMTVTTVGET